MKINQRNLTQRLSAELFVSSVDLVLLAASLGLNLYTASFKAKDPMKILNDSLKLSRWFQEKMLQSSAAYAKQRGYLERVRQELKLTEKGRQRLKEQLPAYQSRRPWDNRLHLIIYDVKETSKAKRYQLSRWLAEKRAVKLQKSVWVSVTDLSKELKRARILYQDEGLVLVADLKLGEGIEGEPIKVLVKRWYQLEALNFRYDNFISWCRPRRPLAKEDKWLLKMRYLAILKDDPQLPFELLGKDWLGNKAFQIYKSICDRE